MTGRKAIHGNMRTDFTHTHTHLYTCGSMLTHMHISYDIRKYYVYICQKLTCIHFYDFVYGIGLGSSSL